MADRVLNGPGEERGMVVRETFEDGPLDLILVVVNTYGFKSVAVKGFKGTAAGKSSVAEGDILIGLNGDSLVGFFEASKEAELGDFLNVVTSAPHRKLWFFRLDKNAGKYLLPTPGSCEYGEPLHLDKWQPSVTSLYSPSNSVIASPLQASWTINAEGNMTVSQELQALDGGASVVASLPSPSLAPRPDTVGSVNSYLPSTHIEEEEVAHGKRGGILRLPMGHGLLGKFVKVIRAANHFVEVRKPEEGQEADLTFEIHDEHGKVFEIEGSQEEIYGMLSNTVKREIKKKQFSVFMTASAIADLAQLVSKPFDRRHRMGALLPVKKSAPRHKKKHSYKVVKVARGQSVSVMEANVKLAEEHEKHRDEMEEEAQKAKLGYESTSDVDEADIPKETPRFENPWKFSAAQSSVSSPPQVVDVSSGGSGYVAGEDSMTRSDPSVALGTGSTMSMDSSNVVESPAKQLSAETMATPTIQENSPDVNTRNAVNSISRPRSKQRPHVESRPSSRQAPSRPGSRQGTPTARSRVGTPQSGSRPSSTQSNVRPSSRQNVLSPIVAGVDTATSRPGSSLAASRPESRAASVRPGTPAQPSLDSDDQQNATKEEKDDKVIPRKVVRGIAAQGRRGQRPKTSNDVPPMIATPAHGDQQSPMRFTPTNAVREYDSKMIADERDFGNDGHPFDHRILTASATMRLSESELSRLRRVEEIRTQQNVTLVQIIEIERRLEEQRITMLHNALPADRSRLKGVFKQERRQAGENIRLLVKKHQAELKRAMQTMGVAFLSKAIYDPNGDKEFASKFDQAASNQKKTKRRRDPESKRLKKELGGALKVLNEGFKAQQPISSEGAANFPPVR